jgi:hypothetical protein
MQPSNMVLIQKYKHVLMHFFTFLHGNPYNKSHEFTADELDEVTFDDALNYFHMRCFGAVNPDFADQALIVVHQVNTVEFWKKSLSWFFVNADVENKTQCWQMILFIIW